MTLAAIERANKYGSILSSYFDRKKKVFSLRNESMMKTGSLDLSRISYYRTSDDLFSKRTISPADKNHFVYVLVDFSGSMGGILPFALEEAYTIVRFCEKSGIPFKVVSFTTAHSYYAAITEPTIENYNQIKSPFFGPNDMLELWSSDNPPHTNARKAKKLFRESQRMGGTPLFSSLMVCYEDMVQIRRRLGIQHMNFITITDGGDGYSGVQHAKSIEDPWNEGRIYQVEHAEPKCSLMKYNSTAIGYANLMDIIRQNNINTIGFFLTYDIRRQKFSWLSSFFDYKVSIDSSIRSGFAYEEQESFNMVEDIMGYNQFYGIQPKSGNAGNPNDPSYRTMSKRIAEIVAQPYMQKKKKGTLQKA